MTPFLRGLLAGILLGPFLWIMVVGIWCFLWGPWKQGRGLGEKK